MAIYGNTSYGPTFGKRHNIYIDSTGKKGYNYYAYAGTNYYIPEGGNVKNYLVGTNSSYSNTVSFDDYEVHQVIFQ